MRNSRRIARTWLARVLVVATTTLAVTFLSTGAAEAATKVSGTSTVEWSWDSRLPGQWANCSVTVFYSVSQTGTNDPVQEVRTTGGDCATGPGWNLEDANPSWVAHGAATDTNEACELGQYASSTGNDDTFSFALIFDGFGGSSSSAGMCAVTEICMTADAALAGDQWTDCTAVEMGDPELPGPSAPGNCLNGNVVAATVEHDRPNQRVRVHLSWSGSVSNSAALFQVRLYAAAQTAIDPPNTYAAADLDVETGSSPTQWQNWPWAEHTGGAVSILPRNFSVTPATPAGSQAILEGPASSAPPNGPKGYTNVDMCTWWFGPKVYNDPATTFDEPAGDLSGDSGDDEPPDPINDPPTGNDDCNFSITDPSTWLEGGMCAAVGWLQGIWEAVKEVASAIAGLPGEIAQAIGGLFIPEDGYLDAKMDELNDAWNQTTPAQWVGAVDDVSLGSGISGCSGIPVHYDLAESVEVDMDLGAACTGSMASAASIVRTVIAAGLVIAGFFACVRAVGAGFGWNPTVGSKATP